MTVKDLIVILEKYNDETEVRLDYGGTIMEVSDVFECEKGLVIG